MALAPDVMRFMMGMASLIPLSFPLRYMNKHVKYWYSLILSFALQIWIYQISVYPIFLQHIIVWAIIKTKGPKCGKLVTFESMIYLSGYHLYQIIWNYGGWSMNALALMMVLVCKYSLFAYNIEDGAISDQKHLTEEQKQFRIKDITFMEYLGYINFLPTSIMGPPIEYRYYQEFMEGKEPYVNIPLGQNLKSFLITLVQTVLFISLFVLQEMYMPLGVMRQASFYEQNSFWYVFFYAAISISFTRAKYYGAWKLSMCGIHSSGLSYNGQNFRRVNTVNPIICEANPHVREKINNWNMGVQQWLRKCIYQRSGIKSKSMNQLYVFVVSAFWHGFYLSYYISFVFCFLQLHVQGMVFRHCKNGRSGFVKVYKSLGIVGKILLSMSVLFLFSHMVGPFLILQVTYSIKFLMKIKFVPQLILIALMVLFSVIRPPKDHPHKHKDESENKLLQTKESTAVTEEKKDK